MIHENPVYLERDVVEITGTHVKKVSAALSKIEKIHDCDPDNWTTRVSTPGFEPTYMGVGSSTWTCDSCSGMVVEAFTKACGVPPSVTRR